VLIGDNATSPEGGRGVRFKQAWTQTAAPSDATFTAKAVGRPSDASGKR